MSPLIEHTTPISPERTPDHPSRREFLSWMAAITALLSTEGCMRTPLGKIIPRAVPPEVSIPGKPLYYASSMEWNGEGLGVLVESHMGRPVKIEGNELHPGSLGATNTYMQASVLDLYDPDRSRGVLKRGAPSDWDTARLALSHALEKSRLSGRSFRILCSSDNSPTLNGLLSEVVHTHPHVRLHLHEPIGNRNSREGSRLCFGQTLSTYYDLTEARIILSIDSDFLTTGPGALTLARQFAKNRNPKTPMNRLYVWESSPSITGEIADQSLRLPPDRLLLLVRTLYEKLSGKKGDEAFALSKKEEESIEAFVKDAKAHRDKTVILAGESLPPEAHGIIQAINQSLSNFGSLVRHRKPPAEPFFSSLEELVIALKRDEVGGCLILDGNPVYSSPADLDLAPTLRRAPFLAHLGLYEDETAKICDWHYPRAHYLESWGDTQAFDGSYALQQPALFPLFDGKSALEVVAELTSKRGLSAYDLVQHHWKRTLISEKFVPRWKKILHDGILNFQSDFSPPAAKAPALPKPEETCGLRVVYRPDYAVWDGRFSNNGWLQELPRPLTRTTWTNVALLSPETASKYQLTNGQWIELSLRSRKIEAPVWILNGQAEETVTLTFGYGRTSQGRIANKRGYNAYDLRFADSLWWSSGVALKALKKKMNVACIQVHIDMKDRELARGANLEQFMRTPHFAKESKLQGPLFEPNVPISPADYPPKPNSGEDYQWGMSIDLNTCMGCQACVVACVAENNIPVVGEEQVLAGRHMHWLRVDRYSEEEEGAQRNSFQPVPCMHCETAPCEEVCPTAATVHSHEGLNQMVYNRCVGTRYCSNNCPYKVRRFNFFDYSHKSPLAQLRQNPDVTIRDRGVMEKCTYCVQRINQARIQAEKENRHIRDGEFTTACAQACPAQAIRFGNLRNEDSEVAKLRKDPREYSLLEELNTKPRTRYLAKIWNPHSDSKKEGHG